MNIERSIDMAMEIMEMAWKNRDTIIVSDFHSFSGGTTDGDTPLAGLIADAKGDLFGTTLYGGANGDGTVFELVKTGSGYTENIAAMIHRAGKAMQL